MEKFLSLLPASRRSATTKDLAHRLDQAIDSARKGQPVDPRPIAERMQAELKAILKDLPHAA